MKTTIKITLIAIVAIGIVAAIIYFANGMSESGNVQIAETNFEKEIQEQVKSTIKDKRYDEAHVAFNSIMGNINTEASVTLADGSKSLKDSEVKKCKQMVCDAYAPIFLEYSMDHFNQPSWRDAELKQFKEEAQELLSMNAVEAGTQIETNLNGIIRTVNEYYAAKKIISQASNCSSVSAVSSLKSKARSYKHEPLTNNTSLLSALNTVEATAKSAVERKIIAECDRVVYGYDTYADYATFYKAYDNANKRIKEYVSAFGYTQKLRTAQTNLYSVDKNALSYYANKERVS